MCLKLGRAKFSAIYCKGNIFRLGVEWRGARKFNGKLAILEMVRNMAKLGYY